MYGWSPVIITVQFIMGHVIDKAQQNSKPQVLSKSGPETTHKNPIKVPHKENVFEHIPFIEINFGYKYCRTDLAILREISGFQQRNSSGFQQRNSSGNKQRFFVSSYKPYMSVYKQNSLWFYQKKNISGYKQRNFSGYKQFCLLLQYTKAVMYLDACRESCLATSKKSPWQKVEKCIWSQGETSV